MASFVVHYLCGLKMCAFMEEKFSCTLSKAEKNEFLLGNFMPDSSHLCFDSFEGTPLEWKEEIQKEKVSTHFRNPIRSLYCIQCPSLSLFLSKYGALFYKHLSVLGYFFHLYTDCYFFRDLFLHSFQFLDVSLRPTVVKSRARFVKVLKNNVLYRVNDFWNQGDLLTNVKSFLIIIFSKKEQISPYPKIKLNYIVLLLLHNIFLKIYLILQFWQLFYFFLLLLFLT